MKHLLTILLLTVSHFVFSQIYYVSSVGSGNPGGINLEGDLEFNGWTNIATHQYNNQWTTNQTLPFPFTFYGDTVQTFQVSQNGVLTFSNTPSMPGGNTNLPAASIPEQSICAFWDSQGAPGYYGAGWLEVKVFGTQPNRQFWIRWTRWPLGNTEENIFSIVLEESSNKIYVMDQFDFSTYDDLTATIGIQNNQTEYLQYGNDNMVLTSPSFSNSNNRFYLFEPFPIPGEDAGITGISSPTIPIQPGIDTVKVTLENFGLNQLDSVQINWEINGVLQSPVHWIGGLASSNSITVTLGGYNFSGGIYDVKVWTELPNGVPDGNTSNDVFETTLCTPLHGTYTVGGGNADFPTLIAAIDILDCGVSGPVTFNVYQGTYNQHVSIGPINGTSSVNTITFNGNNNSLISTLDYENSIKISGAKYITFKNFNFINDGWYAVTGVLLLNGSDHITFDSCRIDMGGYWGQSYPNSIYCIQGSPNYFTIKNSTILGGEYGIEFSGAGIGNRIINNTIRSIYHNSIDFTSQDSLEIIGNDLRNSYNDQGAIRVNTVENFKINENIIDLPEPSFYNYTVGIEITSANSSNTPTSNSQVINNMVYSEQGTGIRFLGDYVDFYHNTIRMYYGYDECIIVSGSNLNILNNVFYKQSNSGRTFDISLQGNCMMNYNLCYGADFKFQGTTYSDLSSLQAAFPQYNQNSVSFDPQFINNTSLRFTSPAANNLALPLAQVTTDIDGDQRPSPGEIRVDMGADEFTVSDIDVGVIPSQMPIDTSALCIGSSLPIEVTLYNYGATTSNGIITVNVTGAMTGSFTQSLSSPLYSNQSVTVLVGNLPITSYGLIDITASISAPGDINTQNDVSTNSVFLENALAAATTIQDETTAGANDGAITINSITGGTAPYTVIWDNGQTGMTIANLAPGLYNATITDVNGCQILVSYEVMSGLISNVEETPTSTFILYPNPANNTVTLEIDLPQMNAITIELLSIDGKVLQRVNKNDVQSDVVQLDVSPYSAGIYLVRMNDGAFQVTKKLVLAK